MPSAQEEIMEEEVKRLTTTGETLRELYLKCGNICAFPGCSEIMINSDGEFIGQLCHIEAAEIGGPRFNKNMSNDDRRQFSNLLLMCYPHHKITHNEDAYSTEQIKRMKQQHELKFSGIIERMQNSLSDLSYIGAVGETRKCNRLAKALHWKLSEEEISWNSIVLNNLSKKIEQLPPETRVLLSIMIKRSYMKREKSEIALHEIEKAIGRDPTFLIQHIDILSRYDISSGHYEDEYGNYFIHLVNDDSGWKYWDDIKVFSENENVDIRDIIVKLNFTLFD
jgi:hypothetical protein